MHSKIFRLVYWIVVIIVLGVLFLSCKERNDTPKIKIPNIHFAKTKLITAELVETKSCKSIVYEGKSYHGYECNH